MTAPQHRTGHAYVEVGDPWCTICGIGREYHTVAAAADYDATLARVAAISAGPDSLVDESGAVIANASAVGNPAEDPEVWVGADLRRLLNPCRCGGVNGFHTEDCAVETP